MKKYLFLVCLVGCCFVVRSSLCGEQWECEVLPPERKITRDSQSDAEIIFITSSPAYDQNLYFHQRSWLPDESILVFESERSGHRELFGHIEATGELVRLQKPEHRVESNCTTTSRFGNTVYLIHDDGVYAWDVDLQARAPGSQKESKVSIQETRIAPIPDDAQRPGSLTENSDGTSLVLGYQCKDVDRSRIVRIDTQTGRIGEVLDVEGRIVHVQSSWCTPDLVYYATLEMLQTPDCHPERKHNTAHMWLVDSSGNPPREIYPPFPNEYVTHACWWVNDQITFNTGMQFSRESEEGHVKVLDIKTNVARIIGSGAWWPNASPQETAHRNWWHQSGSPDGRWVAADNWHGEIAIFSAWSSRTRILTTKHRTYGQGEHPHVGWNPSGTKVVFASNRYGNVDVCIGKLPLDWLKEDW